ncbi:MAG: wax ester/triacylglycerol synthase domain-containing protein, partial [Acidimicrobiales bacterium]
MERMTPGDAAFLHLEDDVSAMHNATLAVFAGPAPTFAELRERVAGRVALVPRLRQRVAEVPLGLSRPVWADDPHFSVDYHVRHTAIPAEGGEEALSALMGRLLGQRLDRGKPLWELWMVRGLDHDRWALISKVHHAALDGVSGTDPLVVVFDQLRRAPKDHQPGITTDMPSRADLLARAAADVLTSPVEQLRLGRRGLDRVGRAVRRLSSATRPPARPTVFTDPGPHRRWRRLRVPLDPLRTRRDELGASTHADVLALVTSGFRTALTERVIPAPAE